MANKTVVLTSYQFNGTNGLTLLLIDPDSGTIGNGAGDTLTAGSNGLFSATVTEAITGWWKVVVLRSSVPILEGGWIYFAADAEGTYIVDDVSLNHSMLTTLIGRITSTVYQTFQDLAQMITGSGTVNAKWTSKALENGPSGTISIPASIAQAATQSGKIVIYRGTSFARQFLNIGDLTNWSKVYFTVRSSKISDDTKSVIQIVVSNPDAGTDGLLCLLAAAASDRTFGSINVDDAPTGDVTVRLTPGATRLLTEMREVDYDIKVIKSDGSIPPLVVGTVDVLLDVTRATS